MKHKNREPQAMEEVHKIREAHYRKTKDMLPDERVKLTHAIVERILKEEKLEHLRVAKVKT
jgi:shikimate kinase